MQKSFWLLCLLTTLFFPAIVSANDDTQPVYIYFGLEPDIITNYTSDSNQIGFINVSVELMLASNKALAIIKHHEPLIRDKIITLLGQQSSQRLRSLADREEIRKLIKNEVNLVLKQESGTGFIENLLFTKFLLI